MSMRPRACKGRGNTMTLDIITLALSGAAAVSYTHLDVYKRQGQHIAEQSAASFPEGPGGAKRAPDSYCLSIQQCARIYNCETALHSCKGRKFAFFS